MTPQTIFTDDALNKLLFEKVKRYKKIETALKETGTKTDAELNTRSRFEKALEVIKAEIMGIMMENQSKIIINV